MEPRPDEIAAHRFPLRLRGVDPGAARRSLLEAAARLDRVRTALSQVILECAVLQKSVAAARRETEAMRERLAAVRAELGRSQDQERARAAAESTIREARATALAALRSTRVAAEIAVRLPVDLFATAGAGPRRAQHGRTAGGAPGSG